MEGLRVEAAAAKGKSIIRHEGMVIFLPYAVPGDVVDIEIIRKKKSYAEARILKLIQAAPSRVVPVCSHYGICGGCKWQHVDYPTQLKIKEEHLISDLQRIGKADVKEIIPILGSNGQWNYRNKVEFTFSNKAWEADFNKDEPKRLPALGFHVQGLFDKVLDLESCHIAPKGADAIRDAFKAKVIEFGLSFYDIRQQTGFLRNLMLRKNSNNEWMLVLICGEDRPDMIGPLFDALIPNFPEIQEWIYVINAKQNDHWNDLPAITYKGNGFLSESYEGIQYRIRPQSFFQTNTEQALELYRIARDFAGFKGNENVYDLYTGTGSIALFLAKSVAQVSGIEYVASAIEDAKENATLNGIQNAEFFAGDMKAVLNDEFIARQGQPDVVITDPPRDGMHPDVVQKLIELNSEKIVYISCNPSTQARDIALMVDHYHVAKVQAVDMFPHTDHVESVALLLRKSGN